MSKGNLNACLAVTLVYEGGYVDHPSDPGGATNMGITIGTLKAWRGRQVTKADVRALKLDEVERIYQRNYWNPVRGDDLPAGVDLAVFDFGVNSGVSRSARYLQASVGAAQDGVIGAKTLTAVASRDAADLVKAICAKRLGFVRGLKTFSVFGRGWSRRIADIEARGVKMALQSAGLSFIGVQNTLKLDGKAAAAKSKANDRVAGGVGAGGSVGAGAGATVDLNWWIIGGVLLVVAAVVVMVKSRAMVQKDRAEAYQRAAVSG